MSDKAQKNTETLQRIKSLKEEIAKFKPELARLEKESDEADELAQKLSDELARVHRVRLGRLKEQLEEAIQQTLIMPLGYTRVRVDHRYNPAYTVDRVKLSEGMTVNIAIEGLQRPLKVTLMSRNVYGRGYDMGHSYDTSKEVLYFETTNELGIVGQVDLSSEIGVDIL